VEFLNVKNLAVHKITTSLERVNFRFKICSDVTLLSMTNAYPLHVTLSSSYFVSAVLPTAHANPQHHGSHIFGKLTQILTVHLSIILVTDQLNAPILVL